MHCESLFIFNKMNLNWLSTLGAMGVLCFVVELTECSLYRDGKIVLWFVDEKLSFREAEKKCQSKNSQLVELQNEAEWDEVSNG